MQIMTDSPIRFPGLFGDWAFTASSKALDIGNGIYWYGILIALGLVIAIWWCMNQKSKYGITEDDLLDSVLWGIPCAIVGARIYYVLFYLDQFKNSDGSFSFRKAIAIWDGGLAIYGAVIAVVIVGICISRHKGYKLGAMLDLAVMGLLFLQTKALNALLLGADYARNLGIRPKRARTLLLFTAGALCAVVTALCGPIAFIGLAAPQVARLIHQTANHHTLLPMSLLWGANMALLALLLGHAVPGGLTLPVNAITPLMGVPVVMMLLTKRG